MTGQITCACAASWPDPEAFRAGWALNDAERLVQSADSSRELERDERHLSAVLEDVLTRYGQRVVDAARDALREGTV